jgi:hypothetical protein
MIHTSKEKILRGDTFSMPDIPATTKKTNACHVQRVKDPIQFIHDG